MYSLHIGEVYSRIVTYLTGAIYAVLTFAVRVIWKHYLRSRYTDAGKRHMLIIALEKNAEKIADSIIFQDRDRYVISGIAVENARQSGPAIGNYRVVADKTDVIEYLKRNWVDDVFLDPELETEQDYSKLRADLVEMGIVTHAPIKEYSDMSGRQQAIQTIGGSRVVTTGLKSVPAWQMFIKRLSDILGGLIGTAITLVLTVFIAPVIWMIDPGPVFFTQTRVGENGKRFKMIKFRSMYKDAERHKAELQTGENSDGLLFKMEADPRIIGCKVNEDGSVKKGFGNFLRDSSLDEFPQFINVLLGQMSMVGTRPPTVDEGENYDLHHRARLSVRPGITGLWQVSGRSNIQDFEKIV
jgi:lipopolysaccharide/colanic/teichoic acid biosynthesis glycosyltransferase